jgi:ligand-binding sensor domain-containing protein
LLERAANWSTLSGTLPPGAGAPARGAGAALAPEAMLSVVARTHDDVWIGGNHGGIWRWDGRELAVASKPARSKPPISDLLLLGGAEVWMAAGPVVIRGTGAQWTTLPVSAEGEDQPRSVRKLAGRSASDVWAYAPPAAGAASVLVHWNGKSWTTPLSKSREEDALGSRRAIRAMAVAPDGTLWIAAETSAARLAPGHDLETVLSLPLTAHGEDQERLQALWVASNDEVWFASSGAIRRWTRRDGWRREAVPGAVATEAICAGPTDLWAGGNRGVLHKRREASP